MSHPALESLRSATRERHAWLEAHLTIGRVGASEEALSHYLRCLSRWLIPLNRHVWARPWAAGLSPELRLRKELWFPEELRRRPTRMGREGGAGTGRLTRGLVHRTSESELLGMAYVIEGATLGGRVLARRFAASGVGVRFFEGYGEQTGPLWKALVEELERVGARPGCLRPMAAAARDAFERLAAWLLRTGAARP